MGSRRLTDEKETELLGLYQRGVKVRTVAEQFGVSDCYPTRLAKRRGIPLRQPHAPQRRRRNT